jgi:hypothetical protein
MQKFTAIALGIMSPNMMKLQLFVFSFFTFRLLQHTLSPIGRPIVTLDGLSDAV